MLLKYYNTMEQTPAEVDKWTLPFGTVIDNPFIKAHNTDDTDNRFKN